MTEARKRFKAAMKSYKQMGKHLKRVIGSRSKSTILGLDRQDDSEILKLESKFYVKRCKMKGYSPMSGKPKVIKVKQ